MTARHVPPAGPKGPESPKTEYRSSEVEIQQPPVRVPQNRAAAISNKYKVAMEYCKTAPATSGFCYDNGFEPTSGNVVVREDGIRYYCAGTGICRPLIDDDPIKADEECNKSGLCVEATGPIKKPK
jgi:hypothetical protein